MVLIGNVHCCTSLWLGVKKAVIGRDSGCNMTWSYLEKKSISDTTWQPANSLENLLALGGILAS
jgi:hypothetical protein